jgi:hypothetical protein
METLEYDDNIKMIRDALMADHNKWAAERLEANGKITPDAKNRRQKDPVEMDLTIDKHKRLTEHFINDINDKFGQVYRGLPKIEEVRYKPTPRLKEPVLESDPTKEEQLAALEAKQNVVAKKSAPKPKKRKAEAGAEESETKQNGHGNKAGKKATPAKNSKKQKQEEVEAETNQEENGEEKNDMVDEVDGQENAGDAEGEGDGEGGEDESGTNDEEQEGEDGDDNNDVLQAGEEDQ